MQDRDSLWRSFFTAPALARFHYPVQSFTNEPHHVLVSYEVPTNLTGDSCSIVIYCLKNALMPSPAPSPLSSPVEEQRAQRLMLAVPQPIRIREARNGLPWLSAFNPNLLFA